VGFVERLNELELLEDGARPAVRDDDGQCVLMLGPHVDEMDVETVDLGDEIGDGIQPGLDLAPVVVGCPVARECLHGGERHTLREVRDGLALREPGRGDAPAQVSKVRFRRIHLKRTNRCRFHHVCEVCHREVLSRAIHSRI